MSRPDHPERLAEQWYVLADGMYANTGTPTSEIRQAKQSFYRGAQWLHDEIRAAFTDNDPTRIDGILRRIAFDVEVYQETLGK